MSIPAAAATPVGFSKDAREARTRARGAILPALVRPLVLIAIVAGAAVLRLVHLTGVPADPYYDAAVRSMGSSWHNFLFGALEPGGTVSLDKPPLDLWPSVVAAKLLGYSASSIRLPEALAGAAAAAFAYLAVRRASGTAAGLCAAAALAVLPVDVITSRSDTSDVIMMALVVLALYLVVRATQSGQKRFVFGAAAVLGLAFNVKLTESWVSLPPLALILWLGWPRARRRIDSRLVALAGGACVYVVVALAWLSMTLLVPSGSQPYAVGSTNGSPWNAAFVFNGIDRLRGLQQLEGSTGSARAGAHYPEATQAQRDAVPLPPTSPTRLLATAGPLSGERLGLEALVAVLLGVPALLVAWRRRPAVVTVATGSAPAQDSSPSSPAPQLPQAPAEAVVRVRRAMLAGLTLWLFEGVLMVSAMSRLHPRYTESFTPAVAAMLGIGVVWATAAKRSVRVPVVALVVVVVAVYAERLLRGTPAIWWATVATAILAVALAAAPDGRRAFRIGRVALAPLLVCALAVPAWASVNAVNANTSFGTVLGHVPAAALKRLSAFLTAHQGSARFETAYDSATAMGSLVGHDGRPVLALTTTEGHVVVTASRLAAAVRAGQVRYAVLDSVCLEPSQRHTSGCAAAPVAWVLAHGRDISKTAGLPAGMLWRLPIPRPAA